GSFATAPLEGAVGGARSRASGWGSPGQRRGAMPLSPACKSTLDSSLSRGSGDRRLLHEARVDDRVEIDLGLDHAALEQQLLRLLQERLDLAAEELLVRRLVLPAQVGLRLLERGRILLHRCTHGGEGFLRLLLDHLERLEIALGDGLGGLAVLLQE